jgi:putative heme-binding domain-containing protein
VLLPLLAPLLLQDFDLPPGLTVARAASERHSYLALCAAGPGRLVLSTEEQGLQLAFDGDGDGWFEKFSPLGGGLSAVQGLAWVEGELWIVGRRGNGHGLWRAQLGEGALSEVESVLAIDDDDEHGAHGIVPGPDGRLYLTLGDAARPLTPATNQADFREPPHTGLPVLPDPGGFGQNARWPYGHVAAIDPATGQWELFAAGLRNAYDLAFVGSELFTVDSDMEWDVGLPWYRPVRVLHLARGSDHGSRSGSGTRPGSPPALTTLGRGSPTGMVLVTEATWPGPWRGALLVGDWTNARLTIVYLARRGDSWVGASETLVQAKGAWNVTDLTFGSDGALYAVSGGRGVPGELLRITWSGSEAPPAVPEDLFEPRTVQHAALELDLNGLFARLEGTDDPLARLEIANHLRALSDGWNPERAARALDLYEEVATYSGGGNLRGYVRLMLEALLDRLPAELTAGLAERGELGPLALATLLARSSDGGRLLAPLRVAFARLDGAEDLVLAQTRKRALLLSLAGVDAPGLDPWLRELYDGEPNLEDVLVVLLAARPDPLDFERHLAGLTSGRWEVRQACADALLDLDRRPEDAPTLRRVLDEARRRGPRGGARLLAVMAHWTGQAAGSGDPAAWPDTLTAWERWFRGRFPTWTAPERGPDQGPSWDLEATATFLERSVERAGSAQRGARVFRAATCDRCHTLGSVGSGWAPDLTGVSGRFELRALLEALVNPSAVVAERYATSEISLVDGRRFDGRVVRESDRDLEVLLASGRRVVLAHDSIVSRATSSLSAMPEGLLSALTLEEVKDLLAYLAADGDLTSEDPREAPWVELLADAQRPRWGGAFTGWKLTGQVLAGKARGERDSTSLVYDGAPNDFELEFDVLCGEGESGLMYRARFPEERSPEGYRLAVGQGTWASIVASDGRGRLATPTPELEQGWVDPRGWNHVYLRVEGDRQRVELNGVPVTDLVDGTWSGGRLGFQLGAGAPLAVWFANARLRSLR